MPKANLATKVNEKELLKLYDYDHFESLDEVEVSLTARRKRQEEVTHHFGKLLIPVESMRDEALEAVQKVAKNREQLTHLQKAVNDYYDCYPTCTIYFVGSRNTNELSHIVLRKHEEDEGVTIPLSELAINETLYKAFNLNQRTMQELPGDKQADMLNYIFNTSESNRFRGMKKIRLNHLGEVRSIHSKVYKYLDHLEVIEKVREFVEVDEAASFDIYLDERFMLLSFIFKNYEKRKYKGDVISAGLQIFNSEVGLGSLQVYTLLNVNDTQFIVKPDNSALKYREIHKGYDSMESLESFANHLDFATNYVIEVLNKYKTLYNIKIDNAKRTITTLANRFPQTRGKKVQEHLIAQAEEIDNLTYRDVVHLFANLSLTKKHRDVNFRHEMQKIGGTLINYSDDEILEIL